MASAPWEDYAAAGPWSMYEAPPTPPAPPPPKSGLAADIQRGTESMLSSELTGAQSLLGGKQAAEAAKARQEDIEKRLGHQEGFEAVKKKYEESGLFPAIGEYVRQIPGALAEQAPQIAQASLAGRGAAMAATALGAPELAPVAGLGGVFGSSFLQQYGGNIERQAEEQRNAGKEVDVSRTKAALAAIPQAALDVAETFIPMGKSMAGALFGKDVQNMIYKGATHEVKRAAAEQLAKEGLLKTLAVGTAKGALAEVLPEVAQQALERAQAGLSLTDNDALEEYGKTAFETTKLGPIGALGRVAEKSAARTEMKKVGPPEYDKPDMANYHVNAAPGAENAFVDRARDTATHMDQMGAVAATPDYDQMSKGELFGGGAPVVTSDIKLPEQHTGEITHAISESGKFVPVQYAVVEAGALTPSQKIDGTPNAEYSNMGHTAIRPVAGNGRVAGIQEAYAKGNATDYKEKLLQDDTHGISKDVIDGMKEPVLVRVIPKRVLTPDLVAGLNVKPEEQAQRDAQHIDPSIPAFNQDGTINKDAISKFIDNVPRTEHGDLYHPVTNQITHTGANRFQNALLSKGYGNESLISTSEQSRGIKAKNTVNGLAMAAPEMAGLDGAGEYDLRKLIADASVAYLHAYNKAVPEQGMQAISNGLNPNEKKVFDFLNEAKDQKQIGYAFNRLANLAKAQSLETDPAKRKTVDELLDGLKEDYVEQTMPTNEKIYQTLKGKSVPEILQHMVDIAPNSYAKEVAQKVYDKINKFIKMGVPITCKFKKGLAANGSSRYSAPGNNIRFDVLLNPERGARFETIVHEFLHVASQADYYLSSDKNPHIKALNDLAKIVREQFLKDKAAGKFNATQIFHINYATEPRGNDYLEFITKGMTNRETQEYLSTVKVGDKTAFDKLVEWVRKSLGLDPQFESALDRLVRITSDYLEASPEDTVEAARQAGLGFGTASGVSVEEGKVKHKVTPRTEADYSPAGKDAMALMQSMKRKVEPPPENFKQKVEGYYKDFKKIPNKTEVAKTAFTKFYDKFSTKVFSTDSALNNAIRRAIEASGAAIPDKVKGLLNVSLSQTVHADALGNRFLMDGNIKYDDATHKWVSVKDKDNLIALANQLDVMAKKHGLTKEEAELIAHTAFEAKRLKSLQEFNKTAKKKDEKYIHMTDQQIADGMKLFKTMPELNKIVDTWNGMRKNAVKVLVDSGLWNEDEAEFLLSNADYVPFYRDDQIELNQGPKEFITGLQVQAKERRLQGSEKPVHDIFDNMVRWTQYAVNRSIRNKSALSLIDASVAANLAERVPEVKRGMDAVKVWRDGKIEYYDMADPLFVEAFNGLESIAIPTVKYFSKIADVLRKSVVMYPLFSVSQVPQDSFAAIFSSGLKPKYALSIPARAVKEFVKTLMGTSKTHEELKKYGVVGVRDYSATAARMDAEVFAGIKGPPGFIGQLKNKLEHISMASDNAVRQAVYEAAMAQGVSKGEALEKAFEVINFRKRGSSKMLILAGQTIPFFNAYIAAQSVAVKTISGQGISPQERNAALQTLAATTASVMALSMLYAMMNGDDDDYLKKPATVRDRLLMIPGTGGLSIPLRTDLFTLPKILTEHMYLLLTNNGTEDGRKFRDSMVSALGNALLSPTVVPQAVKPLLEVKVNYDFFQGKPLIGKWQEQLDVSRQFNDSTSEFSKLLGQTGLVSPINADHVIRGMFGSVGGLFLLTTNQILHSDPNVPKPEMTLREMITALPGTSGFIAKDFESGYKKDFYTLRDEVDRAASTYSDIKKRSPSEAKEFMAVPENRMRVGMHTSIDKIAKELATIRTAMAQISNKPGMDPAEKEEKITRLKESEVRILKNIDIKKLREKAML